MRTLLASGIFGIAIAVGCGGRTIGSDTGAGGSTGSGTGSGGTTGTGGGTTVGGTTSGTGGGTTVGGTTSGTGGTGAKGGAGGTGGAGGAIDPGADLSSCTGPGQCELTMAKCCLCGTLGLDQLAAINSARHADYTKQICGPNPAPCPPCVGTIDPHLMARCESGRCRGFDIRSDPTYTKCGSNQECVLRKGLGCCQCGAEGDWVAVSQIGNMLIGAEACAAGTVCPTCVPVPPAGTTAVCRNGACEKNP